MKIKPVNTLVVLSFFYKIIIFIKWLSVFLRVFTWFVFCTCFARTYAFTRKGRSLRILPHILGDY
ncbi:MAG: hypothetical protein CL600_08830 [Alteromonas sp.]|nr:hypothetical protein [Alteromonas sp.]